MAEYHVGCGLVGIYAGTLNKKKDMWLNKSDVTKEAICSVIQYLYEHIPDEDNGIANIYTFRNGDKVRVSVEKVRRKEEENHG